MKKRLFALLLAAALALTLAACGMFATGLFLLYRAIVAVTTCPWINEEGVRAGVGVYMPWEDVHFGYVHRRAQVKALRAEVVRVEHAAGHVAHRAGAAEPDAAERGPVHAGRKLCDDCGDAVADRLRAQLNARGTAHLPRDLARLAHKRALDVCSAKVNADIVHGTVLPTGKIFSRIIPAAARNCKGSAALADGFFELFQRPLFDAGDIAS